MSFMVTARRSHFFQAYALENRLQAATKHRPIAFDPEGSPPRSLFGVNNPDQLLCLLQKSSITLQGAVKTRSIRNARHLPSKTASRHSFFSGRTGGIGETSGAAVGSAIASLRSVAEPFFMNRL